jgi:hypothetical protein
MGPKACYGIALLYLLTGLHPKLDADTLLDFAISRRETKQEVEKALL